MMLKKALGILLMSLFVVAGGLQAQTASFNFSAGPHTVAGWTNVYGNPANAVCSGTSGGITVSSVAPGNWVPFSGDGNSSYDGGGADNGTFFPAAVMANHWFQYGNFLPQYNAAIPQLILSGLNKDSVYTIKMTGSDKVGIPTSFDLNPVRYTVAGAIVYGYVDIDAEYNTADGAVFHNIAPDASGNVKIYVNTYNGSNLASICGIQVITGRTTAPQPVVAFTHPTDHQILSEDGIITIAATATEDGGSITRVEFYANSVLLVSDSVAPYTFNWINADPGSYTLKARAIDGQGNTTTVPIDVTVQSLNYFWSTTGNIATGADSSFVGTVDTNDLAFRTNNIERMRMLKNGTISIPGTGVNTANQPAFRVYGNGDVTMGTTMDRSVNTKDSTGIRYNARTGILQIGASDRLDSTLPRIAYGPWPTSALIINTDEPNTIRGRLQNTLFAATTTLFDSTWRSEGSFITMEQGHFTGSGDHYAIRSYVGGYNSTYTANIDASMIDGIQMQLTKPISGGFISGYAQTTADTINCGFVSGAANQVGGLAQFTAGMNLVNRSRGGAAFGMSNVDFSSLPWTGWGGLPVANALSYPVFTVGNGIGSDGLSTTNRSNALTVLYNGRTQINTTGGIATLTQAAVTPKAALDVVSTNTGVLLPRLTTAQRNAIVSGDLQNGLLLYNTDSSAFQYYNGTAWSSVGSSTSGSTSDHWTYNNGLQYDSVNSIAIGTNQVPTGYMLAVKGSGIFTHLQVKSVANWPDYVFEKKYQLRTLEDLEAYIDRYKHLPDVVSVARVNAEGVDLGSNQAAILKNVEELTLHLIDENKQLKTQNARINDLQAQIDALKELLLNKAK